MCLLPKCGNSIAEHCTPQKFALGNLNMLNTPKVIRAENSVPSNSTHYSDVKLSAKASQITGILFTQPFVQAQIKTNIKLRVAVLCSPHKGPVTRKMFPFDDVIMNVIDWIYQIKAIDETIVLLVIANLIINILITIVTSFVFVSKHRSDART